VYKMLTPKLSVEKEITAIRGSADKLIEFLHKFCQEFKIDAFIHTVLGGRD